MARFYLLLGALLGRGRPDVAVVDFGGEPAIEVAIDLLRVRAERCVLGNLVVEGLRLWGHIGLV